MVTKGLPLLSYNTTYRYLIEWNQYQFLHKLQVQICFCLLLMVSLSMFMSIYHLLKVTMLILLCLAVSASLPSYFLPNFFLLLSWPCSNLVLLTPGLGLLFLLDRHQEHVSR